LELPEAASPLNTTIRRLGLSNTAAAKNMAGGGVPPGLRTCHCSEPGVRPSSQTVLFSWPLSSWPLNKIILCPPESQTATGCLIGGGGVPAGFSWLKEI